MLSRQDSWRDLCTNFIPELFWQDLCKIPFDKISVQDLELPVGKISVRRLLTRSLQHISTQCLCTIQDLCKSSFGKISVRGLLARSLCKISTRNPCTRSLQKPSIRDFLVKISAQDLLDDQNEHRATARAIWQTQRDERMARAMSKFEVRHSESDLTGPKWRKGCVGDLKSQTAKAIRCERNDYRGARATSQFPPRHNESCLSDPRDKRVRSCTCNKFSQNIAPAMTNKHWKSSLPLKTWELTRK